MFGRSDAPGHCAATRGGFEVKASKPLNLLCFAVLIKNSKGKGQGRGGTEGGREGQGGGREGGREGKARGGQSYLPPSLHLLFWSSYSQECVKSSKVPTHAAKKNNCRTTEGERKGVGGEGVGVGGGGGGRGVRVGRSTVC